MDDEQVVAPPTDELEPDAEESPSGSDGESPSPGAPTLPDAQELRNRLAAMGREKAAADARAQALERQVASISQTMQTWQTQSYQANEQAELEQIARLPVHEQALARAERAERKLDDFSRQQAQRDQAAQQDAYMRTEAQRLLNLANESYGLTGTDKEISYDQLSQQAWASRDAYIAALAATGQARQEMAKMPKGKANANAKAEPTVEERIERGVQAALEKMGVSSGASAKPRGQQPVGEGTIDRIVTAPRNNAMFKNNGPQARVRELKEAREALAARVK